MRATPPLLIDTDVLIESIRRGERPEGCISVMTLLEFLRGVPSEERGEVKELLESAFCVIRLDNDVIETYCRLYQDLKGRGELIGDVDLLIGATAIAKGLRLATRNRRHYERLRRYGLEFWDVNRSYEPREEG